MKSSLCIMREVNLSSVTGIEKSLMAKWLEQAPK